ncbi:MAG: ABC transporter ATP-binding protein [Leptolyngbyaceae cyanobacterium T60_A2020_046]|nr:ABC transporter ATP-binding protein [Leptolyngbyaceae cyanobacterium T60_A2020_046]
MPRAIATAVLDQDLALLPNGFDTRVGTRGFRLSGGQKQRAAAVRMLLRQPQLLVFDDLSSALDVETEQQLWERLFEDPRSRHPVGKGTTSPPPLHPINPVPTCLVVSHRPAVLKRADWVIRLYQVHCI